MCPQGRVHLLVYYMAIRNANAQTAVSTDGSASDILNKNMLLTAGILTGGSTAIAGGVLLTAALPAQMLTAGALSGGLIYAGIRKDKGLPLNPFQKDAADATVSVEATA